VRVTMNNDDKAVERLALALALTAVRCITNTPTADIAKALDVHAEAMRRAADILDERARLMARRSESQPAIHLH
jgi:hypothetical protein